MHSFQGSSSSVQRIDTGDPADVSRWAERLQVPESRLLAAIEIAGPGVDAIRRALEDMHRAFSCDEV
jgi:hypothetical protein